MLHMWLPFPIVIQIGHVLPLYTIYKHKLNTKSLGQFTCREVPIAYDLDHILQTIVIQVPFESLAKAQFVFGFFWFYFILVLGL